MAQFTLGNNSNIQLEALGDNAIKASKYGIKNLKRIIPNLESIEKPQLDD